MLLLLAALVAPAQIAIATPRGETVVPVTTERGGAAVPLPPLIAALNLTVTLDGSEATVGLGNTTFIFQLGMPFVRARGAIYSMSLGPYLARDTLFLPLDWVAVTIPQVFKDR
ncbi:MAG TPA: stalk domain-containing protein, partial [Gemmatimonadales bacterium]|nr:stalk domain-containing protein [Gemmatimonadales bacterium]